ncbi:MAG TPA: tetratricopeptide repeat protein [Polyangiaceae bacterium]|nr:tetratricopeptide repeat protein [Polyangiaceae bacterium]
MSDSDKKAPIDDFDWDSALSEWDKQPFSPEVAQSKRDAKDAPPPSGGANKPLYRPPMPTTDPAAAQLSAPPPVPKAPPKPAPPLPQLRRPVAPPPAIGRKGGGLGQLFSKPPESRKAEALDEIDVLLEEPMARKRFRAEEDDEGVVTSAVDVETAPGDLDDEPLRVPSADAHDVPEGAMFDPFSEPPPGREVPTVHPPPMIDSPRAQQTTAPAFDELPDEAVTGSHPVSAESPAPRRSSTPAPHIEANDGRDAVMSVTSEVEEAHDFEAPKLPSVAPATVGAIEGEQPAAAWLDEETIAGLRSRAVWLEDEARNVVDKLGSAKLLLAVSELRAIVGDLEEAARLAQEAKELAPHLPLAQRQVRGLAPRPVDGAQVVASLDEELGRVATPAAKVHATAFAAQTLSTMGDEDGAAKWYDQLAEIAPGDARGVLARAVRALVRGELTSAALRVGDAPELATLGVAVDAALRARGVDSHRGAGAETSAFDALRRARASLEKGDVAGAVDRLGELAATQPGEGNEPPLARGARWLGAALAAVRAPTRRRSVEMLDALAQVGDALAPRELAARGVELGDAEVVARATVRGDAFSPADRVALAALLGAVDERREHDLAVLASDGDDMALAAATLAAAGSPKGSPEQGVAYAEQTAGSPTSRSAVQVGRLLASGTDKLDAAADAVQGSAEALARALRLESARLGQRQDEIVAALAGWSESEDLKAHRALAAALVAERAGLPERAVASYAAAAEANPADEIAARLAAEPEGAGAIADALRRVADAGVLPDPEVNAARAALLRLEALLRATPEDAGAELAALGEIHKTAPSLPFAAFLAQRVARRQGDVEAVVHWLRERRQASTDPLERSLDAVREALLVADTDVSLATERLEEAHRARPEDVALRELLERVSPEPLDDRAAWREQRAAKATGEARDLLLIEAAYEHERSGVAAAALAAARTADADGQGSRLARIALERAELASGDAARLADELLGVARSASDVDARREAYERLADLDATARNDPGSALLWHRTILEESPAHKASLRYVEHALLTERRDDELEPIMATVARALDGAGGECSAHAEVGARLRMRAGDWEGTREYAEIGAKQTNPAIWALRLRNAHARAAGDDKTLLESTLALLERSTRPLEVATLSVRAAEAALRLGDGVQAEALLEKAAEADMGDVVVFKLLAAVRLQLGKHAAAAEAYESLARTAAADEHRVEAYYTAACLFADEVKDGARAIAAFEQAAAINVTYKDLFQRLSKVYAQNGARAELAALLERRIATVLDPDERVSLEVDRGRALAEAGDHDAAKEAYQAALAVQPDHVTALEAMGELCVTLKDYEGAEQVWVRLARLLATPEAQLAAYRRLADLYADHLANLSRAEVALREVLKRAPDDVQARERLVDVYKKQNDAPRALEVQQELLASAPDPATKRKRLVELSSIHEVASRDLRKAEQTLEAARREFPSDVGVLRALAEFYIRHKQTPAVNILLDRAAGDARRAFGAGRFSPALFETMVAVYELRGKQDAARVVGATLAAWNGEPTELKGAEGRAFDPRLDELLAPELMTPAARSLLARTGHGLDAATAADPKQLRATPLPASDATARLAASMAQLAGMQGLTVLVSPQLGRQCVSTGDKHPTLVVGDGTLQIPEPARVFLLVRAIKLMQVHGSAFARVPPNEVPILIGAWLRAFAPNYVPPGVPPGPLAEASRRLQGALPKNEPDLGLAALEVGGAIGPQLGHLGGAVLAWANHAALLAVGDPNVALDAIGLTQGPRGEAPPQGAERGAWISRTPEAKEIVAFSVSDAYTEARSRLGLK